MYWISTSSCPKKRSPPFSICVLKGSSSRASSLPRRSLAAIGRCSNQNRTSAPKCDAARTQWIPPRDSPIIILLRHEQRSKHRAVREVERCVRRLTRRPAFSPHPPNHVPFKRRIVVPSGSQSRMPRRLESRAASLSVFASRESTDREGRSKSKSTTPSDAAPSTLWPAHIAATRSSGRGLPGLANWSQEQRQRWWRFGARHDRGFIVGFSPAASIATQDDTVAVASFFGGGES